MKYNYTAQRSHLVMYLFPLIVFSLFMSIDAVAQTDVLSLRDELIDTSGDTYIAVRDTALSLEQNEFNELIALLKSADPISQEYIIASALQTRRDTPEIATEFDEHLQYTIENPIQTVRSNNPRYEVWWPRDTFVYDPLGFELIIKPVQNGSAIPLSGHARRQNPSNIDSLLYLGWEKGFEWVQHAVYAAKNSSNEQARITPIIVDIHKYWRMEGTVSFAAGVALSWIGTQLQLDALYEIKTFESELLPQQGFTPWDCPTLDEDIKNAIMNEWNASKTLSELVHRQEVHHDQSQALIDELTANYQVAKDESEWQQQRRKARSLWEELNNAIAKLEEQLN